MNHDQSSVNLASNIPGQVTQSTVLSSDTSSQLTVERSNMRSLMLAATQTFDAAQTKSYQQLTSPAVDNFLPSANRLLVIGGLSSVGALGLGMVASSLLTHQTIVKTSAVIQPVDEAQVITANIEGDVEDISVQNYDQVIPDQAIASFENASLQAEIFNAKERLTQLQGHLAQIDRQIVETQQRRANPPQISLGTAQAFDYSLELLLTHKNELNAQLAYQQNRLEQAEQKTDTLNVYSPKAGILYELTLNTLGQTVDSGEPIAKVVPVDAPLEFEAFVSDPGIEAVDIGFPVEINVSNCKATGSNTLQGHVKSIEPATSQGPKFSAASENSYTVTVEPNSQVVASNTGECKLLPGIDGDITIVAKQEKYLDFFLRKLRFKTNA